MGAENSNPGLNGPPPMSIQEEVDAEMRREEADRHRFYQDLESFSGQRWRTRAVSSSAEPKPSAKPKPSAPKPSAPKPSPAPSPKPETRIVHSRQRQRSRHYQRQYRAIQSARAEKAFERIAKALLPYQLECLPVGRLTDPQLLRNVLAAKKERLEKLERTQLLIKSINAAKTPEAVMAIETEDISDPKLLEMVEITRTKRLNTISRDQAQRLINRINKATTVRTVSAFDSSPFQNPELRERIEAEKATRIALIETEISLMESILHQIHAATSPEEIKAIEIPKSITINSLRNKIRSAKIDGIGRTSPKPGKGRPDRPPKKPAPFVPVEHPHDIEPPPDSSEESVVLATRERVTRLIPSAMKDPGDLITLLTILGVEPGKPLPPSFIGAHFSSMRGPEGSDADTPIDEMIRDTHDACAQWLPGLIDVEFDEELQKGVPLSYRINPNFLEDYEQIAEHNEAGIDPSYRSPRQSSDSFLDAHGVSRNDIAAVLALLLAAEGELVPRAQIFDCLRNECPRIPEGEKLKYQFSHVFRELNARFQGLIDLHYEECGRGRELIANVSLNVARFSELSPPDLGDPEKVAEAEAITREMVLSGVNPVKLFSGWQSTAAEKTVAFLTPLMVDPDKPFPRAFFVAKLADALGIDMTKKSGRVLMSEILKTLKNLAFKKRFPGLVTVIFPDESEQDFTVKFPSSAITNLRYRINLPKFTEYRAYPARLAAKIRSLNLEISDQEERVLGILIQGNMRARSAGEIIKILADAKHPANIYNESMVLSMVEFREHIASLKGHISPVTHTKADTYRLKPYEFRSYLESLNITPKDIY